MTPRTLRHLRLAPEMLQVRLVGLALHTLVTALRVQHGPLHDLNSPTDPPTLRAARNVAARASALRDALRSYRTAVRRSFAPTPLQHLLPF